MLGFEALDVDALADALREDGVVVDRVMGSGEAKESHDRIAELIKNVPFPVYVALVQAPPDLRNSGPDANEALAALLHRRIGGEGVFMVHSTAGASRIKTYGMGDADTRVALGYYANLDALRAEAKELASDDVWVPTVVEAEATVRAAEALVSQAQDRSGPSGYPATLTDEDLDLLAERAVELGQVGGWLPDLADRSVRVASPGLSGAVAALGGLTAALILGQTLRGWPRRRPELWAPTRGQGRLSGESLRRPGPALVVPDVADESLAARQELTVFAERIAQQAPRQGSDELMTRVLAAREAAERHVESTDPAAIVGVRTLVRAGERDLARSQRTTAEALVPCFFDPRHPEATGSAGWRLGQGQVSVPCCRACTEDVAAGRTPQTLAVRRRRRLVPYYTRDDVWARTGFGALSDTFALDVLKEGS